MTHKKTPNHNGSADLVIWTLSLKPLLLQDWGTHSSSCWENPSQKLSLDEDQPEPDDWQLGIQRSYLLALLGTTLPGHPSIKVPMWGLLRLLLWLNATQLFFLLSPACFTFPQMRFLKCSPVNFLHPSLFLGDSICNPWQHILDAKGWRMKVHIGERFIQTFISSLDKGDIFLICINSFPDVYLPFFFQPWLIPNSHIGVSNGRYNLCST